MAQTFGNFKKDRKIGATEASKFYLCVHSKTKEKVIVKYMVPGAAPGLGDESLRLLEGEAEIARSLDYDSISAIRDVGMADDGLYIAYAIEKGPSLQKFLSQNSSVSPDLAAHLSLEVAKALAHAHGKGVFHKNLKLSNIFLRKGNKVGVTDFGLARVPDPMEDASSGVAFSTMPEFLAPEQVRGDYDMVDQRTDVYAVGMVLYRLMTGQLPFSEDKPGSIQYKILKTLPPNPRTVNRSVPKSLEAVCLKAISPQVHKRYWSMAEFATDLRRFLEGAPVSAMAEQGATKLIRKAAGSKIIWAGVVIVAVAMAATGAVLLKGMLGDKEPDLTGRSKDASKALPPMADTSKAKAQRVDAEYDGALKIALSQDTVRRRIAALRSVLKEDPGHARALAHLGFAEVFAGRIPQGMNLLAKASDRAPSQALPRYLWGTVYLHYLRAPDRALAEWRKVAQSSGDSVEVHLSKAWAAWLGEKDFDKAVAALTEAQDAGAPEWEIWFAIGYMKQNGDKPDLKTAIKEYGTVMRQTAGYPPALYQSARAFEAMNRSKDAEKVLARAIAIAPAFPDARMMLSRRAMEAGSFDEACTHLNFALDLIPDSAEAFLRRADCHFQKQRLDEALADADQALDLKPGDGTSLLLRAMIYAAKKDIENADRDFEHALKADPKNPRSAFEYALFLERIKSYTDAAQTYGKAIAVDRDFIAAYQRRADLYFFRIKNYEKALADYQNVLRLDPSVAQAYVGAAWVYYHRLHNVTMAKEYLLSGMRYCKDDPKIGDIKKFLDIINEQYK